MSTGSLKKVLQPLFVYPHYSSSTILAKAEVTGASRPEEHNLQAGPLNNLTP